MAIDKYEGNLKDSIIVTNTKNIFNILGGLLEMNARLKAGLMILVILGSSLVGCNTTTQEENQPPKKEEQVEQNEIKIEYSNLVDSKTQEEVKAKLLEAGVSEVSINTFLEWVNDFNNRVGTVKAFKDGFTVANISSIDYGDVILEPNKLQNGDLQIDANCRVTAYLLFKDFVEVGAYTDKYDNYLMFDMEAINNDPKYKDIKESKDKFVALFDPVLVDAGTDDKEHIERIQEEWKKRNINFKNDDKISLITLFLHDQYENKRFVGHTGVLIQDGDGLLFVEKYAPESPYQCTKFNAEQEVVDYLLSREDIYGDDTEGKPIVMKNNIVIG